MRCRYNAVNFLKNIHKRHPIARPLGWGMGCLLVIHHLSDILPEFLQSFMQYFTILDCVITALDCTQFTVPTHTLCPILTIVYCRVHNLHQTVLSIWDSQSQFCALDASNNPHFTHISVPRLLTKWQRMWPNYPNQNVTSAQASSSIKLYSELLNF